MCLCCPHTTIKPFERPANIRNYTACNKNRLIREKHVVAANCNSDNVLQQSGASFSKPESPPGGGWGRVLWYFHTYVDSDHLFGFKILNFNIYFFLGGGFRKKYFWGYVDFVDILGGHHKTGLVLWGLFSAFKGLFLRSMCRMWIF